MLYTLKRIMLGAVLVAMVLLLAVQLPEQLQEPTQATEPQPTEPQPPQAERTLEQNPFCAEDFTYDENGFMSCAAVEYWLGVDVSHHQGAIRWQEVADSGISFAMIRLGYRRVYEGTLHMDDRWEENFSGAQEAGLAVGVYFFSQATCVEEALEEARLVLAALDGAELSLPVVFDWEIYYDKNGNPGRTADVDRETVMACTIAFCDAIAEGGYEPMVYFNMDVATRLLDVERLHAKGYQFWMALYRAQFNWDYRVEMWQYTNVGRVAGIDNEVDIDLLFFYD